MSDPETENKASDSTEPAEPPETKPQFLNGSPVYKQTHAQDRKQRRYRKFRNAPIWIEAACAIGLVIITGFYTYYAHQQVKTAQNTLGEIIRQYPELQTSAKAAQVGAAVSKEALYSVQRAFIVFGNPPQTVAFPTPTGNFYQVEIAINNAGNTPAHALKDRVSWVLATPNDLPENYSFPDRTGKWGQPYAATGANIVPAKDGVMSQDIIIDEPTMIQLSKQSPLSLPIRPATRTARGIVFYGWATYRDIFDDTPDHLSEFCRMLTFFIVHGQQGQTQWSYCPFHNCTDGDCPDYKERIQAARAMPTWRSKRSDKP